MDTSIRTEPPMLDTPLSARVPPAPSNRRTSLSIAIAGSGGSGDSLITAAALTGYHAILTKSFGPQIRGGEAAALLRLGHGPLESLDDRFDLLLAIDWLNVHRFADEIALHPDGLVIGGAEGEPVPPVFLASGARAVSLPLKKMAKAVPGSWINMLALGITGALAGLAVTTFALRWTAWKQRCAADGNAARLRSMPTCRRCARACRRPAISPAFRG